MRFLILSKSRIGDLGSHSKGIHISDMALPTCQYNSQGGVRVVDRNFALPCLLIILALAEQISISNE